jgi:DnaJ-class molecular chaperone
VTTENYYATLGVSSAATPDEIRRAYRVLARRYHPDVNPGRASEEKFKRIAEAYAVLSDAAKRRQYDGERADSFANAFERAHQAYRRNQESASQAGYTKTDQPPPRQERREAKPPPRPPKLGPDVDRLAALSRRAFETLRRGIFRGWGDDDSQSAEDRGTRISKVSLIEVSLSVTDAIKGVRKTVEISDEKERRKISVSIPPGVRSGSVIRFRRKEDASEEIVLIVRVAAHPALSISHRGLTFEVPVSVGEALNGAKIQIPTLDEPVILTVEPGTQSGTEVRMKGQGIKYRDGTRGDLFVRFMIRVPEAPEAVGLKEKSAEIDRYYAKPVRSALPKSLLEL